MPSESHSSSRPDANGWFRGRSTCAKCKRTVCNYNLGGKLVVTDTDRIAVVLDDKGQSVVSARRLHAESCERYAAEAEKEQLKREKAEWARQQGRRGQRTRGM